jgi:hypothetical protein
VFSRILLRTIHPSLGVKLAKEPLDEQSKNLADSELRPDRNVAKE